MTQVPEPIAITGMACRFPGAQNLAAYWQLLRDGLDAIVEVPADRWSLDEYYDPRPAVPGKMSTRWGGFLPDVDRFDRGFFRLSAREAGSMDPQQRLLLEVTWEALEDAGQMADRLAGMPVGVFIGMSSVDYGLLHVRTAASNDAYAGTGTAMSIAANRISYTFDFKGPSLVVDTACSSSLVALHLASHSLRNGECQLAMVGGVNVMLTPEPTIAFSQAGMMAADGRCKVFDAHADGYVRGEGAGAVVLKLLHQAIADGDPIQAIVRGSAVNQDGHSNGLTAPSRWSQEAVLREACRLAGVAPGDVAYVEAHGTGTPLGDPIEINALAAAFGEDRPRNRSLAIGSVKSNIGHLEAAAGLASLMKTVLALRHREIPPSLNISAPTQHVAWAELPLHVQTALGPWPNWSRPALAGVSSFGFGGTNAHVVLEEAQIGPPAREQESEHSRPHLLTVSARDPQALRTLAAAYRAQLEEAPALSVRDVCYSASARRAHHVHRLAVVGSSSSALSEGLEAFLSGRPHERAFTTERVRARRARLAFVFAGEGSQWAGMGLQLMAQERVFRQAMERLDSAMRRVTGWSLLDRLSGADAVEDVEVVQPVLFALQVGLTELWRACGVEPDAVVGHGMGEVAAAHVAGRLTLEQAVRIITARSRLLHDPQKLVAQLADLQPMHSTLPLYSSSLAGRVDEDQPLGGEFWAHSLSGTVFFSSAIEQLLADGYTAFVELGPHPTLTRAMNDTAQQAGMEIVALPTMRRDADQQTVFFSSLAALYAGGCRVDWQQQFTSPRRFVALPAYPWQRETCWREGLAQPAVGAVERRHPLLGRHVDLSAVPGMHVWETELGTGTAPLLADHRLEGTPVLPAAVSVQMALAAADVVLGPTDTHELADVRFERLLAVASGTRTVQVTLSPDSNAMTGFRLASAIPRPGTSALIWTTHTTGNFRQVTPGSPDHLHLDEVRSRCKVEVSLDEHWRCLKAAGLTYGSHLRSIDRIWAGDGEALALLRTTSSPRTSCLDPSALDACFQLLAHTRSTATLTDTYLPVSLARVRVHSEAGDVVWASVRETGEAEYGALLVGADGRIVVEASGLRVQRVGSGSLSYEMAWRPATPVPAVESKAVGSAWLILPDSAGIGSALADALRAGGARQVHVSKEVVLADLEESPTGVVDLRGLDAESADDATLGRSLQLIQALGNHAGPAPRVWLITQGAQAVASGDRLAGVAQAPLWGFGRTVSLEYPKLRCTLVDLPCGPVAEVAAALGREVRLAGSEHQVAIRGGQRYVPRLCPATVARSKSRVDSNVIVGSASPVVHSDGTYLITGGLGGLGLLTAGWLVEQGARHLVLIGRSAPTPKVQSRISELEQAGAIVLVASADVTVRNEIAAVLEDVRRKLPPIRGVIHAAGVLDDVPVAELTTERLRAATAPKVSGASNLDLLCRDDPLDWFVLFSSVAALFGPPTQAAHAAGNAYLDALAHRRRARGLPATSVNWGPWAEMGVAARTGSGARLQALGIDSLRPSEALSTLGSLLSRDTPAQVAVLRAVWPRLAQVYGESGADGSILSELITTSVDVANQEVGGIQAELLSLEPDERRRRLLELLRRKIAGTLRLPEAQVDPNVSLLDLGLDSLVGLELQHWFEVEFGRRLSSVSLLGGLSLAELTNELLADASASSVLSAAAQPAGEPPGIYPLSYGERGLWFLHQLDPESSAYLLPRAIRLTGELDVDGLRRAVQALVVRHAALRSTIAVSNGEPSRQVHAPGRGNLDHTLRVVDASAWSDAELRERMSAASRQPFDIERTPPVRLLLFRRSTVEHILLVVVHHLVVDVWSLAVLMRDLGVLYAAERSGVLAVLTPIEGKLSDFATWQGRQIGSDEGVAAAGYWREQLAGNVPPLDLPTDKPRPAAQSFSGAAHRFAVDPLLARQLKTLANAHRTTLYTVLLAAFQTLLHRYTGQTDMAVGSPVAGRSRPEFSGTVGYFVNTLVLRAQPRGDVPFSAFVDQVRNTVLGAFEHQEYPFALLVEHLRPERGSDRSPLFQALFGVESMPRVTNGDLAALVLGHDGGEFRIGDLSAEAVAIQHSGAQFDVALSLAEAGDGSLLATLAYNSDLLEDETAARMAGHFVTLLGGIAAAPDTPLGDLPLLTDAERQQILVDWNATRCNYDLDRPLHQLIEAQVERTPGAGAVAFDNRVLTYRELDDRANQVARRLRRLGVGPDVLVGACLERSFEQVLGLLGILKAGGAYVALDPEQPSGRLTTMLNDARPLVVLTQRHLVGRLNGAAVLCLDDWTEFSAERTTSLPAAVTPDNLAYVIYTSGSTGQPKGVLSTHRGICNRLQWMQDRYQLTPGERVLHKTPLGFDVSVWEMFWPLIAGGCVVVARPGGQRETEYLARLIAEQRVSTAHFVPSLLAAFLAEPALDDCDMLRRVICSGEVLAVHVVERFFARLGAELHNLYGPTEASIDVTAWQCRPGASHRTVPIGVPIANTQVYVLDDRRQPVPIGIPGELYLGGAGLARGYLNRPDLTDERFVPNPFGAPFERMYRTGDRVRFGPQGVMEFLGRVDDQVKIRGVRVEPDEVAIALRKHPEITDAVVVPANVNGELRLAAYVVPHHPATPLAGVHLRAFLREHLPDEMVPSTFVSIAEVPRLANGKLDRWALPAAADDALAAPSAQPARDLVELQVIQIWEEMLGVPVGAEDDFFELGGHSLLALRLVARLEEVFAQRLPVAVLLRGSTPRVLAQQLRSGQDSPTTPLVALQRGTSTPLFLATAGEGDLLALAGLARHLGLEQTVYGLQPAIRDVGVASVEDIARSYVASIREIQNDGPYWLGGYSVGGVVAFETARQLHACGQQVALLALFDTTPPGARWGTYGIARHAQRIAARLPVRRDSSPLLASIHDGALAVQLEALKYYRPMVYPGRVTLYVAAQRHGMASLRIARGWRRLALGGVDVRVAAGRHDTMLREPHARELARDLGAWLRGEPT
jgi:amino acid adenylation domain-containing protein